MPLPDSQNFVDRQSARSIIYNTLKDWIITGVLKPGERIIDSEISKHFAVSRTPVREALQTLADQNLVEIMPSKGTRVTLIDTKSTQEAYTALALAHCSLLELAFPKIDDEVIQKLLHSNKLMAEYQQNNEFEQSRLADTAFHNIIIELANNTYLSNFVDQLSLHVIRMENLNFSEIDTVIKSSNEHMQIILALKNRNLELAKEALKNNFLRFVQTDLTFY